jgi:hypothetical protein
MKNSLNFGGGSLTPAKPEAELLCNAIVEMIRCEDELNEAKSRVPSYTGQWNPIDFYADEQEAFNRAADKVHDLITTPSSLYPTTTTTTP